MKKLLIIPVLCAMLLSSCSSAGNSKTTDGYVETDNNSVGAATETEDTIDQEKEDGKNELGSTDGDLESRMLEKNYSLGFQTLDYDQDYNLLNAKLKEFGGYVSGSDVQVSQTREKSLRHATLTLKVPTDKADGFVQAIKSEVGTLTRESSSSIDHTDNYRDNQYRIKNLESKLEALRKLYEKAETMEDIIAVQSEILYTEEQLASYEQSQVDIERRVNYSTITMTIDEVFAVDEADSRSPEFSSKMKRAFEGSLEGVVNVFQGFVLTVIYLWPVILFLALLIGLIVFIAKRSNKKRRARQEARMGQHPQTEFYDNQEQTSQNKSATSNSKREEKRK